MRLDLGKLILQLLAEKGVMDGAGARINHQQKLQFPHVPVAVQGQRSHTCGRLLVALYPPLAETASGKIL